MTEPTTSLDTLKYAATNRPVEPLLRQRWSPRAFADRPVSREDLQTIFTAGAWAASSYNEQPWRFVLGQKGEATWQTIFEALVEPNQLWAHAAPVLYASFAKKTFSHGGKPNASARHDVGAASANLSLQATALGLHTHGMSGFDGDKLRAALSVPEDFEPVACWALGYLGNPASLAEKYQEGERAPRERKPLAELVFTAWAEPAL